MKEYRIKELLKRETDEIREENPLSKYSSTELKAELRRRKQVRDERIYGKAD